MFSCLRFNQLYGAGTRFDRSNRCQNSDDPHSLAVRFAYLSGVATSQLEPCGTARPLPPMASNFQAARSIQWIGVGHRSYHSSRYLHEVMFTWVNGLTPIYLLLRFNKIVFLFCTVYCVRGMLLNIRGLSKKKNHACCQWCIQQTCKTLIWKNIIL